VKEGRIRKVVVAGPDGPDRPAFAGAEYPERLAALPDPPARTTLLCPFDPILRDRARALRLFGFDYRFEAFIPEARRQFGYYVLPILEGGALVGRLDPKFHRDSGVLAVRGLWWEPGIRATKVRRQRLTEALEDLARRIGAREVRQPLSR